MLANRCGIRVSSGFHFVQKDISWANPQPRHAAVELDQLMAPEEWHQRKAWICNDFQQVLSFDDV